MSKAIELSNLSFSYPKSKERVLDNLNLVIPRGTSYGLLGINGAGKTTLFSCLCRQNTNYQGTIKVFSEDIKKSGDEILKVGFAPQELALFPMLTAYENLDFFASLAGLRGRLLKERVEWALQFSDLAGKSQQKIEEYSGGMKRRLNLAVALLHEPNILILDEPTVGVDSQTRTHIFEKIEELKKQNITIVYASHYMEEIERLCESVAILEAGKIRYTGTIEDLKKQEGHDRLEPCYLSLTGKQMTDSQERP